MNRILCHFSCGAASAVATKLTLSEHPNVEIVNAFIEEEEEDNRRFATDCEKWFGKPLTVLRNEKYKASTREVWRRKRYMKGPSGAPCSLHLKRELLDKFSRDGDIHIIGFTAEEEDRAEELVANRPSMRFRFLLIERGLTKSDCLAIVDRAGIEIPLMYRLGFDNANCIGCPKGGQNYHQKIRKHFPERHNELIQIQEEIGPGAYFLQFRSGPRKGERMGLKDLPAGDGNMADEPSFNCSFFCAMAEGDIRP